MNRFARVTVSVLALLIAACGDAPVEPQSNPQFGLLTNTKPVAKYKEGRLLSLGNVAVKIIGPAGGSISLSGFEVIVPPGAVALPTVFSITVPGVGLGDYVLAEFGPHAITFNRPVTLKLPYKGTTSEGDPSVHVLWFSGLGWVQLPTTIGTDGRIQAETNHFSTYGTEETDSTETGKGITLAGG